MKKAGILALAVIAAIMITFTAGFYIGRNTQSSEITVSFPQPAAPSLSWDAVIADDAVEGSTVASANPVDTENININTATLAELTTLPGIGEVLAPRIIDYREANGPFASPEELTGVSGIGTKRLEAILEFFTVGV